MTKIKNALNGSIIKSTFPIGSGKYTLLETVILFKSTFKAVIRTKNVPNPENTQTNLALYFSARGIDNNPPIKNKNNKDLFHVASTLF